MPATSSADARSVGLRQTESRQVEIGTHELEGTRLGDLLGLDLQVRLISE